MTIKSILVPTDFQNPSIHAVHYAFDLATKLGAVVHLLHVYEPVVVPTASGSGYIPHESLHRDARAALEQVVAPYRGSPALGERITSMGDPKREILQLADERGVDLIVLGSHGRRGLQRVLLGSVAEPVMRESRCPVLIARESELDRLIEQTAP